MVINNIFSSNFYIFLALKNIAYIGLMQKHKLQFLSDKIRPTAVCVLVLFLQAEILLVEGCSKTWQTRHNTPHEKWQSATAPGSQPNLLKTLPATCHVQAEHEPSDELCSFLQACDLPARHHLDLSQPVKGRPWATDGKEIHWPLDKVFLSAAHSHQ